MAVIDCSRMEWFSRSKLDRVFGQPRRLNESEESATVTLSELAIALRCHGGEVTPGRSISSYAGELTKVLVIPSLNLMSVLPKG